MPELEENSHFNFVIVHVTTDLGPVRATRKKRDLSLNPGARLELYVFGLLSDNISLTDS